MLKKLLALFVAAMMVFSIIPVSSFAEKAVAPPAASEKAPTAEPIPTPPAVAEEEPAFEALKAQPVELNTTEIELPEFSCDVKIYEPGKEPPREKWETYYGWDFEEDPTSASPDWRWRFHDQDGDGYTWGWVADTYSSNPIASSGTHAIMSLSYISGTVLTPDNWAITPEIQISGYATMRFNVASYRASYPETFRIYYCEPSGSNAYEFRAITSDLQSPTDENCKFSTYVLDLTPLVEEGKTSIMLAFRHYNCSDQYRMYIDDVSIVCSEQNPNPTPTPEPTNGPFTAPDGELIYGCYFESGQVDGWQGVDVDGDGQTWSWYNSEANAQWAYEGRGFMVSFSGGSTALTPDNLLKSSLIEVPANSTATLSFLAGGFPVPQNCSEHFEVYATDITNGFPPVEVTTQIIGETVTGQTYMQYTADLSEFAGKSIHVIFRHFNCTNQLALRLDKVEVYAEALPVSLDEAMNVEGGNLHFVSNAPYPWYGVDSSDGKYARSGNNGIHSSQSSASTTFTANHGETISFDYFSRGESTNHDHNWDVLQVFLDGAKILQRGKMSGWDSFTTEPLTAGEHTLTFTYKKDGSTNPEGDLAMIRNVSVNPYMPIVIDTIEINDFVAPAWGEHPFYDVSVPEGAPYYIYWAAWMTQDGDSSILEATDVFNDATANYRMRLNLNLYDGYVFAENPTILLNGEPAPVLSAQWIEQHLYFFLLLGNFTVTEPIVIDTIEINDFVTPAWGEHPFFDVTVPEDAPYSIDRVRWMCEWPNGPAETIFESDVFNGAGVYNMSVKIVPNEGYVLASNATATINGSSELVRLVGVETAFNYCWVDTIDFTVEEPAPPDLDEALNVPGGTLHFESTGDYPWFAVSDEETGRLYAMSGNAGVHSSSSSVSTTVTSDGYTVVCFDFKAWGEGASYDTCQFLIDGVVQATWGGYKNEEWETYTSEPLTAGEHTLKWKYTKDSSVNPTGDYFAVDNVVLGEALPPPVTAEPVNIITRVDVLDLVLPAWGAAPVYSASVPDDVHYSIDRIEWYAVNGSYLLNNYPYMVFDDPNELYRAFIFLTADEGYEFAEEVTATINGEQSLVDHEDDYYGQCVVNSIGFTVTAPSETNPPVTAPPELEIIDTIELIGFVEPVWGAAPSCNVTVPEGANYTITEQGWFYYDGLMAPVVDGDLFNVEGREYSMIFRVLPAEGYTFAEEEEPTVTINGREDLVGFCTVFGVGEDARIDTIDFTVTAPSETNPPVTAPPELEIIDTIELIGFVEPVWGAAPSCNVTVPDGANYTITEQGWYYYTGDMTPLEDGELFNDEGREYSMIFRLVPAEGYVFANSGAMTVTINGRDIVASCYVFGGGTSCRIDTIDFTVTEPGNEPILIDTVEINDFMVPTWGAHPDFEVSVPEGAMYSVSSICWFSKTDDDEDTPLTADDVFDDESLRYYAVIYFEAAEGYAFSPDAVGTVNGGTEYIRDFNAPDSSGSFFMGFFTVTEPTTDPTVIDTIEINDFVAPVWGEHPFFGVTVPEGANYRISSVEWKYSANGTDWESMDSGAAFDNETFVYFMEAKFLPNDGYRFSDELTFMINGGTELVMFSGLIAGEAWLETQIFTVEEPAPLLIDTIEINGFVVPTWGAAPFYDVTVPDDAPYSISYNVWSKWDYNGVGALGQMQPGETFNNPNWAYYQYFNIIPDEGYDFADEVTILINGETTYVSHGAYNFAWGYGYYYIFTIDFYVEEPAPILGDVNRDGEVTLDDALLAMRYVLGLAELTDEQLALADVNGDGEVSMLDALMILRKTMGIIDSFPVENLPVTSLRIK